MNSNKEYSSTRKNSRQHLFFKKNIETTIYWIDRGQLGLTYQIYN